MNENWWVGSVFYVEQNCVWDLFEKDSVGPEKNPKASNFNTFIFVLFPKNVPPNE